MTSKEMETIGRAEKVAFPELELAAVPARIDTGARTSTVWGLAEVVDGRLQVVLFGEDNDLYDGRKLYFDEFEPIVVASSNGQTERRYKVRLLVRLGGRKIRAWFTLADRSTQVYPVLIGRNVLRGKFIVDVKKGDVLYDAERKRTAELRAAATEPRNNEESV
jgi:hypothetical protein